MDPKELENKINDKTKVIMPVHMLGMPANMIAIKNIADKHNLKIIEDNCESIGASIDGKYLGTIGDVGVISFDHGKALTTGEGGMLLTNSKVIDTLAREYHDHGHQNNPDFPRGRDTKQIAGFNFRMTEIQAAIGKVQLTKLDYLLKENAKRYKILDELLSDSFKKRENIENIVGQNDCYIFNVPSADKRSEIIKVLVDNGIGTKNLPDAIEWHCSYFWDHIFENKDISDMKISKDILEAILHIKERDLSSLIDKFLVGKLLQAGWHSKAAIKYRGIEESIKFAPKIREGILKVINKEPLIYSDLFIYSQMFVA